MSFVLILMTTVTCMVDCKIYYIKPSLSDKCPVQQCRTLLAITRLPKRNYQNLTLRFLPGVHTLHSNYSLHDVELVEMSSYNNSVMANISCKTYSRFNLYRVSQLLISGLSFQECQGNKFAMIKRLQINKSAFIRNQRGALELYKTNARLLSVSFLSNSALSCTDSDPQCCLVGGALRIITCNVSIHSSVFTDNVALSGGAIFWYGRSNITIVNSAFIENKAFCNKTDCDYNACKLTDYIGKWSKIKELQMHGGAICAYGGSILKIFNATFIRNQANTTGGAVYVIWALAFINTSKFYDNSVAHWGGAFHTLYNTVHILNSEFHNNSALNGGALDAWRNTTLVIIIFYHIFLQCCRNRSSFLCQHKFIIDTIQNNNVCKQCFIWGHHILIQQQCKYQ